MKRLRVGYSLVLLCYFTVTMAYPGYSQDETDQDDETMARYLRDIKRSQWLQLVCGKWDDWCVPGSKLPALTCCNSLKCKCTLWNTNCRCRRSLVDEMRFEACPGWGDTCQPWSRNKYTSCCDRRSLVCKCNLWAQNCRCASRLWGG